MTEATPLPTIRPLQADDRRLAEDFTRSIPSGERAFFDRSLMSDIAIAAWTRQTPTRRFGAFGDERMVGVMSVTPGTGWVSHVGDLRIVVAPEARGRGLLGRFVDRSVDEARSMEVTKLMIEVSSATMSTVEVLRRHGFGVEATLPDHVRIGNGELHDLLLLTRFVDRD